MPKRKKRGITVVRNPLNFSFISIIHTFFFFKCCRRAAASYYATQNAWKVSFEESPPWCCASLLWPMQNNWFFKIRNCKQLKNRSKWCEKGQLHFCVVCVYVGAFESSFNHVSRSDKFCIMTTNEIIFSYSYIIHIIFNSIFKKSNDF